MTIDELRELNNARTQRARPRHQEHDTQCECVKWFRMQYPHRLIYANANGGARDIRVAANMRREGVTAGVPDLSIPEPTVKYHGLFIEMKNSKQGRLSEPQIKMIADLRERGYCVEVCRSSDDFIACVRKYFQ